MANQRKSMIVRTKFLRLYQRASRLTLRRHARHPQRRESESDSVSDDDDDRTLAELDAELSDMPSCDDEQPTDEQLANSANLESGFANLLHSALSKGRGVS